MYGGEGRSNKELGNLKRGKGSLDNVGNTEAKSGDGVVSVLETVSWDMSSVRGNAYHHGVNARVDQSKHPDGR